MVKESSSLSGRVGAQSGTVRMSCAVASSDIVFATKFAMAHTFLMHWSGHLVLQVGNPSATSWTRTSYGRSYKSRRSCSSVSLTNHNLQNARRVVDLVFQSLRSAHDSCRTQIEMSSPTNRVVRTVTREMREHTAGSHRLCA